MKLVCKDEDLNLIPEPSKDLGMLALVCNPDAGEGKTGGSNELNDQPG